MEIEERPTQPQIFFMGTDGARFFLELGGTRVWASSKPAQKNDSSKNTAPVDDVFPSAISPVDPLLSCSCLKRPPLWSETPDPGDLMQHSVRPQRSRLHPFRQHSPERGGRFDHLRGSVG